MNPKWFGDSFDIVKRFFISTLKDAGYDVYVDPKFIGDLKDKEAFFKLVGAQPLNGEKLSGNKTVLFLDPDTGIGKKPTQKHIIMEDVIEKLKNHDVVFSFDQSFARSTGEKQIAKEREKLGLLQKGEVFGFYYNSHAKFLFAGRNEAEIRSVYEKFLESGLPEYRFIFL